MRKEAFFVCDQNKKLLNPIAFCITIFMVNGFALEQRHRSAYLRIQVKKGKKYEKTIVFVNDVLRISIECLYQS